MEARIELEVRVRVEVMVRTRAEVRGKVMFSGWRVGGQGREGAGRVSALPIQSGRLFSMNGKIDEGAARAIPRAITSMPSACERVRVRGVRVRRVRMRIRVRVRVRV